jgi:hypothetical protein
MISCTGSSRESATLWCTRRFRIVRMRAHVL